MQTVAMCGENWINRGQEYSDGVFPRVAVAKALLLLRHFRRARLCATPQTAAHQAPRPWDSPGKNTGGALVHTQIFLLLLNLGKDSPHPHFHRTCRQRPGRLTLDWLFSGVPGSPARSQGSPPVAPNCRGSKNFHSGFFGLSVID